MVGRSGCGKSSLIRLLLRFYNLKKGRITINGQDIAKLKADSVRRHLGIVPQDTVLFHDTIGYNIKYGNLDATDNEIYGAAINAHLHQTVMRMSKGYDTVVGQRGAMVSGGERQRVSVLHVMMIICLVFHSI